MARLEAISKGLFYPTPERVIEILPEIVNVIPGPGRLLDTCAGEGVAAKLAAAWGLQSYGVELHRGRAATAATVMTKALHGSYHQLYALPESFSVLFLNPPYDIGEGDGRSVRQEIQFYHDAIDYLAIGGLLVFVIPAHILGHWAFRERLGRDLTNIRVWRFPDPEFEAFKQLVVVGRRRRRDVTAYASSYGALGHEPWDILGDYSVEDFRYLNGEAVKLPSLAAEFRFELRGENPHDYAPTAGGGCYRLPQWKNLIGENDICVLRRPLVAPRPGHVAMLLAAGALDGTDIGGKQIVKGSSKKIITHGTDEEAGISFERERIVSNLAILDLTTGEFQDWRTDEKPDETKKWFADHGAKLAAAVRRDHVPLYDGDLSAHDFSRVRAPGIFLGNTEPVLLDAQKRAAAAVVQCWTKGKRKSAIISGEMGCGKTAVSITATTLANSRKVVVVMPTHLVRKWMREVDTITQTKGAAHPANNISDVDAFFASPRARYLVLSKERAKLGARWKPAVAQKTARIEREVIDHEAERGRAPQAWYAREAPPPITKTVFSLETVFVCPSCGHRVLDADGGLAKMEWIEKNKRYCFACKGTLWQSCAISARGTARWPLAKYINERHAGAYDLIIDEVHQYANASSDQSRAVQLLCTGSRRILAMTGTLYGGRASSIFHLLYKVDPQFRDLYEYTDSPRFVADHGLLETIHKMDEYTSRYGHRRNNSGGRVREVPGVNPAMLNLILSYTVFLKLADLGVVLPPFEEQVELIDHDEEVKDAARSLMSEVKTVLRKHPRILGQYLMACLGYPDCPEHAEEIIDKGEGSWSTPEVVARAPAFDTRVWPKDRAVIRIVKAERKKGRKSLVFFSQTGKRSPIPRVKTHLEAAGLKVAVLDGSVPPDEREEWLLQRAEQFDVLLTNGRLVETGLDLLFATTIIQYGTEYSIPTLRQSTRRSWRLGQTKPVKVIYLAYKDTMQDGAMTLIAKKMRAAELVDGDDLGGLSQHDEAGHDFLLELAREAAGA